MDEIRDRLQVLDRLDMPNLWERAEAREPHQPDPTGPTPARRVAIAALALAIAAAGIGFAVDRLTEPAPSPSPADTTSEPVSVHAEITATIDTGQPWPEGAAVGEGGVWVATRADDNSGDVLRLDPVTGEIVARIPVPTVPGWEFGGAGITTGLGQVWVTGWDQGGAVLERIDPGSNELAETIPVGPGSDADVWVDASGIWVLTIGHDTLDLYHLDITTHRVQQRIEIPANWSNSVFAAGGWIWVLGNTDNSDGAPPESLFKIDPATGRIVERLEPADGDAISPTLSGDRIWFWHDGLRALDPSSGQEVVGPIDVPPTRPFGDGVGGVWVISATLDATGDPGVWHVTADGLVDRHSDVHLGPKADGIAGAFDPSTNTAWVVHYDRTVSLVRITPADAQPTSSVSATNTGQ